MTTEMKSMHLEKLDQAFKVLQQDHERGWIPGYDAIVLHQGKEIMHRFGGYAEDGSSGRRPLTGNSLFDMASLTKVLAVTTSILHFLERGEVRLHDRVSDFIPQFGCNRKEEITLKHCLTHTTGLIAHRDLHSHGWSREEIIRQICNESLIHEPGSRMIYSDLGFILLGEIVAKVSGQPLHQFVTNEVFGPLGMKDTSYLPDAKKYNVAATEFREHLGRFQCGEVHDENAAALGGISGHAGLFSTAKDVSRYGELWLNEGVLDDKRIFSPVTIDMAIRSHTQGIPDGNRGIGWALKGDPFDASGDLSSTQVYGHTGFTGTSIVIDPVHKLGIVLLTNRVHYGREPHIIRTRARFHNAVYASLEI